MMDCNAATRNGCRLMSQVCQYKTPLLVCVPVGEGCWGCLLPFTGISGESRAHVLRYIGVDVRTK